MASPSCEFVMRFGWFCLVGLVWSVFFGCFDLITFVWSLSFGSFGLVDSVDLVDDEDESIWE